MKYDIVLSRAFYLERIAHDAEAGKCPCHVIWKASKILDAKIYQLRKDPIIPFDKMRYSHWESLLRSRMIGNPQHWALARTLSPQLTKNDVVFCMGEVGIPVATLCDKKHHPKIAVLIHNINRLRGKLALKLFRVSKKVDLFMTYSRK